MKSLVIADDHAILREALSGQAAKLAGFEVVASVGDAQAAVNECRRRQPDLLLLDIEMPGRDALAAIADVRSASAGTRVVILTAYCRDAFIEVAVGSGAAGYLLKSDPPSFIFNSLSKVASGGRVYSKSVEARLAQWDMSRRAGRGARGGASRGLAGLTPRELEVLRNIGRGMSNEQMAVAMSLSRRTVERHVARLMDAIGIRDRTGIVKFAYEQGLVV